MLSRPVVCIAAVLIAALAGCHRDEVDLAQAAPEVKGTSVRFGSKAMLSGIQTAQVTASGSALLNLNGRVVWNEDHTVRIFSPFAGRVIDIKAKVGDHVTAGQVLARIDSPDYGQAQADYRKAQAAQRLADTALSRLRDLYQHGVIAAKDVEEAESAAASASAERDRAAKVLQTFADAGDAVDQRMNLRSPITGVVVQRTLNEGAQLQADQNGPPLFIVTDPRTRWIALDAHEQDLASLRPGDWFEFQTGGVDPSYTAKAQVIRLDDYVDPASRTIRVIASADNAQGQLKTDAFISAKIRSRTSGLPEVPAEAVYFFDNEHYAFVKEGDLFIRRSVTLGDRHDSSLAIASGLTPGDVVVTHGALFLQQLLKSAPRG